MRMHTDVHTHISASIVWKRLFCLTNGSYEVHDTPFFVCLWAEFYICFSLQFKLCEHIKPEQYICNAEGLHFMYGAFLHIMISCRSYNYTCNIFSCFQHVLNDNFEMTFENLRWTELSSVSVCVGAYTQTVSHLGEPFTVMFSGRRRRVS